MTSAEVVETSATNNSSFRNYINIICTLTGRSLCTKYWYSCVQIIHFNTGYNNVCLFYVARIHHVYVLWKGSRTSPISGVPKLPLFNCHSNKVFILHDVKTKQAGSCQSSRFSIICHWLLSIKLTHHSPYSSSSRPLLQTILKPQFDNHPSLHPTLSDFKIFYSVTTVRAIFTWVSKVICVCFGFSLPCLVIGLKTSSNFSTNQK